MLCKSCVQPKKQFKIQIIGILEEKAPFIGQKCIYEKVTKNLGRAHPPSPPNLDKIQKNSYIFSGDLPLEVKTFRRHHQNVAGAPQIRLNFCYPTSPGIGSNFAVLGVITDKYILAALNNNFFWLLPK